MSVDSTYTLFGIFESSEAAQKAAATIKDVVGKIREWFVTHPNERTAFLKEASSPVEVEMAKAYQLNWDKNWGLFLCDIFRLTTFENLVMLYETERNWNMNHEILQTLMERLGGTSVTHQWSVNDPVSGIDIHLSCTAPDAQTADRIYQETQRYFQISLNYVDDISDDDLDEEGMPNIAPWFGFEGGLEARMVDGTVKRQEERGLAFEIQMFEIEQQFPAFIKFLQGLGFTDISYTFTQAEQSIWAGDD